MTPTEMQQGRVQLGWTQQTAASKLGVSQSYLSLLEGGYRRMPGALTKRAVKVYGTPATALPLDQSFDPPAPLNAQCFAEGLAGLGYPGFSHLRSAPAQNPASMLLNALAQRDLESRLVEALPWVVLRYPKLDWYWLVPRAKLHNLQNRLGYVTYVAGRLAESKNDQAAVSVLTETQSLLENARLAVEGTLCHDSLTSAERSWLRKERPPEAEHWNLLTDLRPEQLAYAHT